jgi:two-component system, NarL family, sensor histidine kinase DesK
MTRASAGTDTGMTDIWDGAPYPRGPGELTRAARIWRVSLTTVWLIYLIQPVSGLFHHHHDALYIGGGLAIVAAFCVIFVALVANWHRRAVLWQLELAALFALAAAGCTIYGGTGASSLWIFVSAVAGLVIPEQRKAVQVVAAAGACYTVFSLIGHVDLGDFLVNLLPTVLLGLAMIGLRRHFEQTRELTQARETVARLAASEERLRMARDMHDLTGQSLSVITLKSELAARLLRQLPPTPERDRARDEIEQVATVSRQTMRDIREAVSGYRRPTLAIEIITARSALESADIAPHDDISLTIASGTFDPDAEAALAWCLREAVTNVVRHSGAKNCHISLTSHNSPPGDLSMLSLEIRDDGKGHVPPAECDIQPPMAGSLSHSSAAQASGTGLRGMSERLSAAGGSLELRPDLHPGFSLIATVPATPPRPASTPPAKSVAARP